MPHKLKVMIAMAFAALAGLPVLAADLGKPAPVAAVAPAPIPDMWNGLYFEGGAAARFVRGGDKAAIGSAGLGWNMHAFGNPWVFGVFGRYGFDVAGKDEAAVLTFDQPVSGGVRAGYLVLPSTLVYGTVGYAYGKGDDRGAFAGLGMEAPVLGSLRLAVEYTAQFDKDLKADRDVIHNIGVFARIPF